MSCVRFIFFLLSYSLANSDSITNGIMSDYSNNGFQFLNLKDSNFIDPDVIALLSTMIILIIAIFTYSVLNFKNMKNANGSIYIKTEKTLADNSEKDLKSSRRGSRKSRRISVLKKMDLNLSNLQNDNESKVNEEVVFDNVVVIKKKKKKKVKENAADPADIKKTKKKKKKKMKKIKSIKEEPNSNLEITKNISNINLIENTNSIIQGETNSKKEEKISLDSDKSSESYKEEISNKDIKLTVSVEKSNTKSNAISLVSFSKLGDTKKASPKKKYHKNKNNHDEIHRVDTENSKNSKMSAKKIVTNISHRDIIQYTNEDRSISDDANDEELELEELSDESITSEISGSQSDSSEDPSNKNLPQVASGSPVVIKKGFTRRGEISR